MWVLVSLIPMPFLFHYYEISQYPESADFLFIFSLFFAGLIGFLTLKVKIRYIIFVNLITIFVSIWLGAAFITPPNGSWFAPIGMNFAIVWTGVVILVVELILRSVFKAVLSRK